MLKHLPKDTLKNKKTLFYSNSGVQYNNVDSDRRIHNADGITTTGLDDTQIATLKANYRKDLHIDDRI